VRSIAELLRARANAEGTALRFEQQSWSYPEYVGECMARAKLLLEERPRGPFHVGVLMDNLPDYPFLIGGAALAGATVAGLNSTRRGAELERDIRHTDCGILIFEEKYRPLLEGLDTGVPPERTFVIESEVWQRRLASVRDARLPEVRVDPKAPFLLIFTSGTTGHPKAAICSQSRLAGWLTSIVERRGITPDDVLYQSMPMLHANAIIASLVPIQAGGTLALKRRFSASGFLPDVRRFGATVANYVGKPLSFVLATPEQPDDADNSLRLVYGNEAAVADVPRFAQRFACEVTDSYGSTEGGVELYRDAETPAEALGMALPGVAILDPETQKECPRARFDEGGGLLNSDEAIGEIVSTKMASSFEGYYKNEEANDERVRDGIFWSGDLGYRDERGYVYFAGRGFDWMRVDGENLAAAPVERILARHPDLRMVAVYAVPDAVAGDQVMAALVLREGVGIDDLELPDFLARQTDLSTKAAPRYLRISKRLPMGATHKVLKRVLRDERWECSEPVWLREESGRYRPMTKEDRASLREQFAAHGRAAQLER
jgi:fatty-acyl-CoA synthase